MKHVPAHAFLEGIALSGLGAKYACAFENVAHPIVIDAAAIAASAKRARAAKRGSK